jgi:hypothetical protein
MMMRMAPALRDLLYVEVSAPEAPADERLWLLSKVFLGSRHF